MAFFNYKLLWISLLFILLLSGCSVTNNKAQNTSQKDNQEKTQLEKDMEYLTSDKCDGRRPGTSGNKAAGDYIEERFEEIGLKPLDQVYAIPYTKITEILEAENITLKLYDGSKNIDTMVYGKDFIEVTIDDVNFKLPLVINPDSTDCAVLVEDAFEITTLIKNPYVKLILEKNSTFSRGGHSYQPGQTPLIGIYPDAYNKLLNYVGKTVEFTANVDAVPLPQENLAGVISGENCDHALVISAHYDHVGSVGEMVWRGALDNASGVCTMLETAQILTEFYRETPPPYDIIFCAFNSEETISNLDAGSIYFRSFLDEKYQSVFDINLDCLGNKDSNTLTIHYNSGTISNQIGNILSMSFQKSGISTELMEAREYLSDHKSFDNAVCLSTVKDITASKIHTPEDTADRIDMDYLISVGQQLGECIYNELQTEELFDGGQKDNQTVKEKPSEGRYEGISVKDFENLYQCKLEFADETLKEIIVHSSNRSILSGELRTEVENSAPIEERKQMSLWDLRSISFKLITLDYINFATYDKSNDFEMMAYEEDALNNEFDEASMTYLTTVEDTDYYITAAENNSRRDIIAVYENEAIAIRVRISPHLDFHSTIDEYRNYFLENISTDYINGMVVLLLQAEKPL